LDTGSWGESQTRTWTDTGYSDTGANAWRYWRLLMQETKPAENSLVLGGLQLQLDATDTGQSNFAGGRVTLNAGAKGSIARVRKSVVVSDTGDLNKEHSLSITVDNGPVVLRVGSLEGEDGLIRETELNTGHHSLSFFPEQSPFHITLQNASQANKVVSLLRIGDTGKVEITAPWLATDLSNIRFDQSADVVFVSAAGIAQYRIERRGSGLARGRSWSVVEYVPELGPFRPQGEQEVRLSATAYFGNGQLISNIPFFKSGHVGALFRLTHTGQSKVEKLGNLNAATEPVVVTGISETDTGSVANIPTTNERYLSIVTSGTFTGEITIERSFEGKEFGFSEADDRFFGAGQAVDTGGKTATIHDLDTNSVVYYRARMSDYTSGTAFVTITARRSVTTSIFRVTEFIDSTRVNVEVLKAPGDTGSTEDWQEGSWSTVRGFPTSVALHEGRLGWAGVAAIWLSVSDDYSNFDDEVDGSSSPINRTFGSGPVESVFHLSSMENLIAGTADSEMVIRSSSEGEVLTAANSAARRVSSQGSANVRPIKRDQDMLFVQRSNKRLFRLEQIGGKVKTVDMTSFVPSILETGVVSLCLQRQPDTRMHFVLADGTVAIFLFDPEEGAWAWFKWVGDTGTNAKVEQAACLPALEEDAVFYLVRREINGVTKRFLEKWAKESESMGDSGLSYLADCSVSYTHDTGDERTTVASGLSHLIGESVVAWGDDTGQALAGKDLSYDIGGVQKEYTVAQIDSSNFSVDTGTDLIAVMTGQTTGDTTVTASSTSMDGGDPWVLGDDNNATKWFDTGDGAFSNTLPSWVNVQFSTAKRVGGYTIRNGPFFNNRDNSPTAWRLLGSDYDTGSYATDTGKWVLADERSAVAGWLTNERKKFRLQETANTLANWRFYFTAVDGDTELILSEIELFEATIVPDGIVTLDEEIHHVVLGLPFKAVYKSSKLAYAAQTTGLAQMKRADKIGFVLYKTHNNGLFFGNDTGELDPLPRKSDGGAVVDADKIFETLDIFAMAFPGLWDEDSRIVLQAKSPRPATVMAAIPSITTNEKI